MLEKYGVEFNSQREDKKHIWNRPKIPLTVHSKLIDYEWMNVEYNIKKRSLTDIAAELDVYYSTVAEYCHKFGFIIRPTSLRSLEEIQIVQYIKSLGCNHVKESDRTNLDAPTKTKEAVRKRFELFIQNQFDPILNNHSLTGIYEGCRSINITGDWRAIYFQNETTIFFIALGTHSQLYK